jgi:hypothetical protein
MIAVDSTLESDLGWSEQWVEAAYLLCYAVLAGGEGRK